MNETEFQQLYATFLKNILPTIQANELRSERSFSIKFGHKNVLIDGLVPGERAKLAIYDVLILLNDQPVIMLELKKPGNLLTEDDRDQGISYARLTTPITPVTIVTNGTDFNVYDTYSKDKLEDQILDNDFFLKRIKQAAAISKTEYKNAITNLIESDQRVLYKLFNSISETAFNELIGNVDDFSKPIANDFCVPRQLLPELKNAVETHQFVALTGNAYIGKTNLLYQYFLKSVESGEAVLYINCIDFHYSLFRKLTNNIHSLLQFPIDELKLKEWLLLHFNDQTEKKVTVIFDHVRYNIDPVLMADISELLDLFKMDGNRIIICADQSNFELLKVNTDRILNTIIGNNFFELELLQISTSEFVTANEMMFKNHWLRFSSGSQYSDIYRLPRIWRLIIGIEAKTRLDNQYGVMKSIPGVEFLEYFRNTRQLGGQTVADFLKLIDAFLDGRPQIDNSHLKLMARNLGIITEENALKYLNDRKINQLIYAGYLERRAIPGFQSVLINKLPELLAGYAAEKLNVKYIPWFKRDFENAYKSFIQECEFLPHGELVACRFILDLGDLNELDLYSDIVVKLFNDEPVVETSTSGKEIEMYVQKIGSVNVKLNEGEESSFMGNGFPYLILAHFFCTNFNVDTEHPEYGRLELIGKLANKEYIIRKPDSSLFHEGLPTTRVGNLGELVNSSIGIVEPITQAIYLNLMHTPDLFKPFYTQALQKKQYQLLHRIYIAARFALENGIAENEREVVCNWIERQYNRDIPKILAFALSDNPNDSEELRKNEKSIRALNSNSKKQAPQKKRKKRRK